MGVRSYIRSLYKEILNIEYKNCCLYVGQMIHRKGIDILLESANNFDKNTGLIMVGGTPTVEYFKTIKDSNLTNIKFINFLVKQEINLYYKAADIFVLPTREDIWGLVINEKMAFGLPIITTNKCIAGLELISDYENGFIIPADNVDELNRKIKFFIENPEKICSFSMKNLEKMSVYTIENMALKHLEILKET